MAVIQSTERLEIYGLFTDVVVVFCASNIHGLSTPRHHVLVCGKTRATILPRENFITKHTHKHTFLSFHFWAEMSENRNRILMQIKNRLKIYNVNKVCQTGQKCTFYVEI